MRILVALSRPALAAAAGALTLLLVTDLLGAPNVPVALAFFVAFFVAAALQLLDRRAAAVDRRWRFTRLGGPERPFAAMTGPGGPFDRFDDRAKRVLALAQDEAIRFNHYYIGTEHLLLGFVREGDGVAARALDSLGVDLSKLRTAVEFTIGRGESKTSPSQITLSPRTKKVIELAIDEARKLGTSYVGTEHLLLGVIREGEGIGSGILESLGISLQRLRREVMTTLGRPEPKTPSRQAGTVASAAPSSGAGPFDRFNDRAKRVLALSQDEAVRFNHNYIGTEHLLLGLVREGDGAAARALRESGVDLERCRQAVGFIGPRGDSTASPPEITLSPRTRKVFELAVDEADRAGRAKIGSGDLLLGLIREGEGIAMGILDSLKVDREALLKRTREKIAEGLG
ncbi:MAG: hypothetical protein AUH85_14265 [Chloroflexi bacterium 13_1_40CM_4_68_4]|nr:MAG: hypothetical protein AUH85_14265 [Chloroflexi bacterium 13_1_40CM_4_68_4]